MYYMMISQENFDESMPSMMNEHAVKRTVDDVSAEVTRTIEDRCYYDSIEDAITAAE
jgi:hypothetical protein